VSSVGAAVVVPACASRGRSLFVLACGMLCRCGCLDLRELLPLLRHWWLRRWGVVEPVGAVAAVLTIAFNIRASGLLKPLESVSFPSGLVCFSNRARFCAVKRRAEICSTRSSSKGFGDGEKIWLRWGWVGGIVGGGRRCLLDGDSSWVWGFVVEVRELLLGGDSS
jgi:hypothetical protein